ncbi:transporter [Xanthomonas sp. CFBP 8445]|uniref:transporter n=1 Tax=Xanthomonas sp. CFBP 8445 TaxID=2971236 RepID=UPI0021DFF5AA|nr:transporter [Xanthomonas sp. CFBP 8445]UYC13836.1 transporter [Xanthomonas sp. CFBP 8445]
MPVPRFLAPPSLAVSASVAARHGRRPPLRRRGDVLLRGALLLAATAGSAGVACADDAPAFDRPGIGFASSTLQRGQVAWEQAFFDGSYDRDGDVRSTEYVANSRLRIGLSARTELQLAIDSQVWQRVRGGGQDRRGHSGGDASIGLKQALPSTRDGFTWALLGSASLPVGRAPYGDAGHRYDLGLSAGWDLPQGRSVALYGNVSDSEDGSGWSVSPSYTFYAGDTLSAYVEAGIGGGEDDMRALGSGVTWLFAKRVQLDVSVLRGLSSQTPDWQGGLGISMLLR